MASGESSASRDGRPPVAVEVDTVRFEPINEIRQFTGTVFPLYQYIVAPKISGRLVQIKKRIGDWLTEGERIALIDDAEYQQSVREAEANLKIAQASLIEATSQLELARQDLERVQVLQQKGIASSAELDAANTSFTAQQSRLELARAQVEQRNAALKSTQIRLSYTTLDATQPGFIGERYVDEGALLSVGSPVVSVVGIEKVIIRTTVVERDYGRIQLDQTCEVEADAFPGTLFIGHVARIAPVLEEASRVAKMELEVDNDQTILKPGMFAKVGVILSSRDNAQTIPTAAVVTKDGKPGVFVVLPGEKKVQYIPVQIGIVSGGRTEIVAPAIQGMVVTLGQHLLEDGSPILLPGSPLAGQNNAQTKNNTRKE